MSEKPAPMHAMLFAKRDAECGSYEISHEPSDGAKPYIDNMLFTATIQSIIFGVYQQRFGMYQKLMTQKEAHDRATDDIREMSERAFVVSQEFGYPEVVELTSSAFRSALGEMSDG